MLVYTVFAWAAAGAAAFSAVLWWCSATVRVPVTKSPLQGVTGDPDRSDRIIINDETGLAIQSQGDDVLRSLRLQGKWNRYAALMSGLTAALQLAAMIFAKGA